MRIPRFRAALEPVPVAESAYAQAGVNIDAKMGALGRLRARIRATHNANVLADVGHFGGMYALPGAGDTVLVASVDSVGTKVRLAIAQGTPDAHEGIGRDIVHHCVNDILCCGAKPLFFLDYLGIGVAETAIIEAVVGGVADACAANGMALIGGEVAELAGIYAAGDYDLAGCVVGSVARDKILYGYEVQPGDVLLGLPSAGLHTNGFSLARRAFGLDGTPDAIRARLAMTPDGMHTTLGVALLAEHRSYLAELTPALDAGFVKALAHITGGGLIDNVPRVLPDGCAAYFDPAEWVEPPVFGAIRRAASVAPAEMYRVFNMGIGMVVVVGAERVQQARSLLPEAVVIGTVAARGDGAAVRIAGVI